MALLERQAHRQFETTFCLQESRLPGNPSVWHNNWQECCKCSCVHGVALFICLQLVWSCLKWGMFQTKGQRTAELLPYKLDSPVALHKGTLSPKRNRRPMCAHAGTAWLATPSRRTWSLVFLAAAAAVACSLLVGYLGPWRARVGHRLPLSSRLPTLSTIEIGAEAKPISDTLFGIFFEEVRLRWHVELTLPACSFTNRSFRPDDTCRCSMLAKGGCMQSWCRTAALKASATSGGTQHLQRAQLQG